MITLTASASRELERQMRAEGKLGHSVRFGLRPGGCAGTKYLVEFTSEPRAGDSVYLQGGLRILCDPFSLESLRGLKVDFVEALVGGGFQYENPNSTTSCNCGKSFATG